ncbi:MAG: sigma-70 family RNA polymerase sigma factor [Tissierellia bacterium]|nr:sigma-70 family RNA polymerase sigma factor [Tissierellia bacterium]
MFFILTGDNKQKLKFERLYKKYNKVMFYVANNILQDECLAEDAVQQAFINIYKNLDRIDESDCRKTRNFLVIICKNVSIDMYNQRKKHAEDQLDTNMPYEGESVSDIVISTASIDELHKLVGKLNSIYQEVVFLKFIYDFSVEEIANMKNINTKTVQKRIERAKKQLIKLLNKEGELNG